MRVLQDGVWTSLSENLRVCSIGDYFQDAILLVDLGGRLLVNSNDAGNNGAAPFVQRTVQDYDVSFLLALTGYGDADMINFFDEAGNRIPPPAAEKLPFGEGIAGILDVLGIRYYVPFAAMHRYQRTDSAWANECTTPLGAHDEGFQSGQGAGPARLPALRPGRRQLQHHRPGAEPADRLRARALRRLLERGAGARRRGELRAYLQPVSHLRSFLGYVNFRVGGRDCVIDVNREHARGITFEVPRASLMSAVEYRVFDDLMIGNFVRTTLHGPGSAAGPRRSTRTSSPTWPSTPTTGTPAPRPSSAPTSPRTAAAASSVPRARAGAAAARSIGRYLDPLEASATPRGAGTA